MSRRFLNTVWVLGAIGVSMAAARPAWASAITVTTTTDNDVADSQCTLREAITSINNNASYHGCSNTTAADTILLPVGTIQLTSALPNIQTRGRTIRGLGYNQSTIYGALNAGFHITSAWATFSDLTLRGFGNAPLTIDAGAAAYTSYVKLIGEQGCIYNNGIVEIANSHIELCNAFRGSALWNVTAASNATIRNSTITKSFAEHGLIVNVGTLLVQESTISGNTSGNTSGAIDNVGGSVSINTSTFAYDDAKTAAGSAHILNNESGTMSVQSSVIFGATSNNVAFTPSTPDCRGTITSNGYNAVRTGGGCNFASTGDFSVTDPLLQPSTAVEERSFTNLPGAGYPGRFYVPATNSPLLGRGPSGGLFGDERGVKRQGSALDVGAVQRGTALFVVGNTSLSIGDFLIKNKLQNLGFTVTVRSDTAVSSGDATNMTIVVISESVTSSNVNTKLRDVHTGVLCNELGLFDDMNMTTGANLGIVSTNQVNLPFSPYVFNPLASAAGYFGVVGTTTSAVNHGWGTPVAGNASIYAENTTTSSQKHSFYYGAGSAMVNNFQAPGHRLGNWYTDQAGSFLTSAGHTLIEAAILTVASPSAF